MAKNTIILLNKKNDVTSFQCLSPLKKVVDKRAGHAGTLDKFATGLVIAFTGKYTRLNSIFMGLDKVYKATIFFGKETTTLDPEGEVVKEGPIPELKAIEKALTSFKGIILQAPPAFSAIHINGERAYKLAKDGVEVKMEKRPVTLYSYNIISWNAPLLQIEIKVSKGFYVRSFARDLADCLGTAGYLVALERTKIGDYSVEESIFYDDKEGLIKASEVFDLGTITARMKTFKKVVLPPEEAKYLYFGNLPPLEPYLNIKEKYIIFYEGDKVLAIIDNERKKTICQVVAN